MNNFTDYYELYNNNPDFLNTLSSNKFIYLKNFEAIFNSSFVDYSNFIRDNNNNLNINHNFTIYGKDFLSYF